MAGDKPEQTASGSWAFPCRLCGLPTLFDEAVLLGERGGLCAGCVAAVEEAAARRREPPVP
jgi:hypothetical protein